MDYRCGKDHARATEYAIFKRAPLVNGNIVLDLASLADGEPRG